MATDHRERASRLWPILTNYAQRAETITYSQAATRIGIHHRPIRYVLEPIQTFCLQAGLPPLTALVVRSSTGIQGNGYIAGAAGDKTDLENVFSFDWSGVENPFSGMAQAEIDQLTDRLLNDPEMALDTLKLLPVRGDAQRVFRRSLLLAYKSRCAVCSLSLEDALEAAHILPWCDGHPEARIDPRNGILLCANHHRFFDAGYLKISDDYRIEFSDGKRGKQPRNETDRKITTAYNQSHLGLPEDERLRPNRAYLEQRRIKWDREP